MLPFPWLPLATNELVPGFCHRSLLYHLKPFPEIVITIKVGPCRAYSFGLCSITERSNDGARPTNIRGRCSSQTRTLSLGARTSGPHLVGASVLPTARDRRTSGAAARPKPARFPWERGPLARIWWEQAFSPVWKAFPSRPPDFSHRYRWIEPKSVVPHRHTSN